jgi:3-mercaptopyruvate sulfurtransferase SseA
VVEEAGAGLQFRPAGGIGAALRAAGIDPGRPTITTCYFGVGASVVATALEIAGFGGARVHAGSLVEYAVRNRLIPRDSSRPAGARRRPSSAV